MAEVTDTTDSTARQHLRQTLVLLRGVCSLLGMLDGDPEEVHTPARTAGLADVDALLKAADSATTAAKSPTCKWSPEVPPPEFWTEFLRCVYSQAVAVCKAAGKPEATDHVAALEMRTRALGPACLRLAGRLESSLTSSLDSVWVQALCAHMHAIAGVPMMSNLADFLPGTAAATSTPPAFRTDMYAVTEDHIRAEATTTTNPLAQLIHAKTFGGPPDLLLPQCRQVLEDVLSSVRREEGEEALVTVRAAVQQAGAAMPGIAVDGICSSPETCAAIAALVRDFEVLCDIVNVEGIAEDMYPLMK